MKKSYFCEDGIWLKGNLHSHTTVSDGALTPKEIAQTYYSKGYDFLSMTDHNVFMPHNELPAEQIILLTGIEHDIEYSLYKCIHVVGIGATDKESTDYLCKQYSAEEITDQQLIDRMGKDGQFLILAHPIWSRMEPDEVMALNGFHAIEVYNNGTEHLCHNGNAEVYWEMLLRHGKRVLAIASDDVHTNEDLFGGWICVKASERSKEAIIQALFKGAYYSSCGPVIHDFGMDGDKVYVSCSDCREIHFITYPQKGKSFFAETKQLLTSGSHTLTGNEYYVRVVCVDTEGRSAWTNAIFFDGR